MLAKVIIGDCCGSTLVYESSYRWIRSQNAMAIVVHGGMSTYSFMEKTPLVVEVLLGQKRGPPI